MPLTNVVAYTMKRTYTQQTTQAIEPYVTKSSRTGPRGSKTRGKPFKVSLTKQIGLSRQLVMRHKYLDSITLTSTGGSLGTASYRCNGMYDPDASAGGHQPFYFDQLTAIYNHFTVTKSKLKVTFCPNSTTSAACVVGIFINDDNVLTPTSLVTIGEQSSASVACFNSPNGPNAVLRSYWDAVKTFGPNPQANDNLQGTASADPTEQSTWTIAMQQPQGGTVSVQALVEIEYTAIWDELKDIAGS